MNYLLLTVGKTQTKYISEGIAEYRKRLTRYAQFDIQELPDLKGARSMSEELQKEGEGKAILSKLLPSDFVILLDERGKEYTSMEFAAYIEKLQRSGRKRTVLVVGGPYGFSPDVYKRADAKLSLSKMTFNHEMVRLFFTEQLYRAMTILKNEPYHHE